MIPFLWWCPARVVTSIRVLWRIHHSAAAEWWLSTAPRPQASTAAIQRPSRLSRRWLIVYTPRWTWRNRPSSIRCVIEPRLRPSSKLGPGHHPVLALRNGPDRPIELTLAVFCIHVMQKAARVAPACRCRIR